MQAPGAPGGDGRSDRSGSMQAPPVIAAREGVAPERRMAVGWGMLWYAAAAVLLAPAFAESPPLRAGLERAAAPASGTSVEDLSAGAARWADGASVRPSVAVLDAPPLQAPASVEPSARVQASADPSEAPEPPVPAEPEQEEFDHPASILYYRVNDIEAAHQILASRGVKFERAPQPVHNAEDHELWLAFFRDMDGNFLALMEEKKPT